MVKGLDVDQNTAYVCVQTCFNVYQQAFITFTPGEPGRPGGPSLPELPCRWQRILQFT